MTEEPMFAYVAGALLHRYPAYEECNLDDAAEVRKMTQVELDQHERVFGSFTRCLHCFGEVTFSSGTTTSGGSATFDVATTDPNEDTP